MRVQALVAAALTLWLFTAPAAPSVAVTSSRDPDEALVGHPCHDCEGAARRSNRIDAMSHRGMSLFARGPLASARGTDGLVAPPTFTELRRLSPWIEAETAETTEEERLIAVLLFGKPLAEKDAACARLKRIGTARSVPALAGLLQNEQLSHSARLALESMQAPEAGKALADALPHTEGMLQAGIIQSLGERRQASAVPALARLLSSDAPLTASAAAAALGRIGGPAAIESLKAAMGAMDPLRSAAADALLMVADRTLEEGNGPGALYLFEYLHGSAVGPQVRAAAYRGMMRASGTRALALMTEAILGSDLPDRIAALQMAHEISDPGAVHTLSRLLPPSSPDIQAAIIAALAQRRDPAAVPAVEAAVDSPVPAVRLEAVRALGALGRPRSVGRLVKVAAEGSDDERKAARQALIALKGEATGKALLQLLAGGPPAVQREAAEALAGRADAAIVTELITLAKNGTSSTRKAALFAIGRLAGDAEVASLVQMVLTAEDETTRTSAGDALSAVCRHLVERGKAVNAEPIVAGLTNGRSEGRKTLFQTCSVLTDERIRAALRAGVGDPDVEIRRATLQAMSDTRDPGLMPDLLSLAQNAEGPGLRAAAMRGYLRLVMDSDTNQLSPEQRVDAVKRALPFVQRAEDKWFVLSRLSVAADGWSLELALDFLADAEARNEAAQAAIAIGARLSDRDPQLARHAVEKTLAVDVAPDQRVQAEALHRRMENRRTERPVAQSGAFRPAADPLVRKSDGLQRVANGFRREQVDGLFRSEGVAVADFNHDGFRDIATGNLIFLGPTWEPRPLGAGPKEYNPAEFSNEFYCYTEDIDRDGWLDLIVVGFPGQKTRWMRNPGETGGAWREYEAIERTGNESPVWVDVDRDGKRELVFASDGGVALARPGSDPYQPWPIRVVAAVGDPKPGHGLGVGDVNGDGRDDVVCPAGWWEGPDDRNATTWRFHPAPLGGDSAQMVVFDIDGDGDSDIASSSAHNYGLWWFEQTPERWKKHYIDNTISQLHALHAADINGDGLPDLVTGKRFWAHREGDPGTDDPAVLAWFELRREGGQADFVRHDINENSGVGLHFQILDLNGDGQPDIVTSNKKGVYIFVQEGRKEK